MPTDTDLVPQFRRFTDHDVSLVSKILSYGVWSGPGYSAGHYSISIALMRRHEARTAHYRRFRGVDAYDHFVARTHDLNELDAEGHLIDALAENGVIVMQQTTYNYRDEHRKPAAGLFQTPPVLDRAGSIGGRFVDPEFYLDGLSGDRLRSVASAFIRYALHIAYSNLQYSFDVIPNRVDDRQDYSDLMNVQILGSSPIFLKEMRRLIDFANGLPGVLGLNLDVPEILDRVRTEDFQFGVQDEDDLKTAQNGGTYIPTFLDRETLFGFDIATVDQFRQEQFQNHSMVVSEAHLEARLERLRREQPSDQWEPEIPN